MLKKVTFRIFHVVDGREVEGVHSRLSGDVSGLYGDVSGLYGDVSGLSGDVSGLYGDVSGLSGDVDFCEITEDERKNGMEITALILSEAVQP